MITRREFVQTTCAAALTTSIPAVGVTEEAPMLPTRAIPGTDEALPVIGLGNSSAFWEADRDVAGELIDIFLAHGGRYVDVAGPSRFFVGELAVEKESSDVLFLGNYLDPKEASAMRDEARQLAEAQGKGALDLVQTYTPEVYRTHLDAYRALRADRIARYIGIARSGEQHHAAIGRLIEDGVVDFVQTNYSLLEPAAADYLLPLAMDKGVAININRPFINGEYFSVVRGHELPEWAEDFDCRSWAQFSLKFILAHPAVNCVLTETSNPRHAVDNLGAGFGRLPDESEQQRMLAHIRDIAG